MEALSSKLYHLFTQEVPLLDVRAEVEFAKGAFPQSTNLPLLNNYERHLVGLCYKQQGKGAAQELGKKLISGTIKEERVRQWVDFCKKNPTAQLYCFRGGLRSQVAQQWLQEEGIMIERIQGGYKALRTFLLQSFKWSCDHLSFILFAGRTGSGKTRLLQQLKKQWSFPVCDLESLANHRGSAFGKNLTPQPSQISFENALAQNLLQLSSFLSPLPPLSPMSTPSPAQPVLIENESRLIGRCRLPLELFHKMQKSPILLVEEPLEKRVQIILQTYVQEKLQQYQNEQLLQEEIKKSIEQLSPRLGGLRTKECIQLVEWAFQEQKKSGELSPHEEWIRKLLLYYYDPTYDRHLARNQSRIIFAGPAEEISSFLLRQYPPSPF